MHYVVEERLMGFNIEVRSKEWLEAHRRPVYCDRCQVSMNLKNTPHGIAYMCHLCKARHGAHQRTGEPLGTPAADFDTRQARVDAHAALDALWRDGGMGRSQVYAWLASKMSMSKEACHIGRFNFEQCSKVMEICESFRSDVGRTFDAEIHKRMKRLGRDHP